MAMSKNLIIRRIFFDFLVYREHITTDINLRVIIVDEYHDKTYNLNFPGSHTVHQVVHDHGQGEDDVLYLVTGEEGRVSSDRYSSL